MKNTFKLFGLIALVAVIAFSMVGCNSSVDIAGPGPQIIEGIGVVFAANLVALNGDAAYTGASGILAGVEFDTGSEYVAGFAFVEDDTALQALLTGAAAATDSIQKYSVASGEITLIGALLSVADDMGDYYLENDDSGSAPKKTGVTSGGVSGYLTSMLGDFGIASSVVSTVTTELGTSNVAVYYQKITLTE